MGKISIRWLTAALLAVSAVLFPLAVLSQDSGANAAEDPPVLEDFDFAWQSISDLFYDTSFGGSDWNRVKEEYRKRVEEASDIETAYQIIAEMLGQLRNGNTFIIPPALRSDLDAETPQIDLEYAGVGILIQETQSGEVLVLNVFSKTPAEVAGVLIGDVIVGINDWRVSGEDLVAQCADRIRGPVGTAVNLTLRDPEGQERSLDVKRGKIDIRPVVEYRVIENRYGYLNIPALSPEMVDQVSRALPGLLTTSGLILDLRAVTGGDMDGLVRIAQLFLGAGSMGAFYTRRGPEMVTTRSDAVAAYQRPIVALVDSRTYAFGEILAYVLRVYRRARIVGSQTTGGYERTELLELPSGGFLSVAVGFYMSPQGERLPLQGVTPEFAVDTPSLETVRQRRDVYIEKAIEVLKNPRMR